MVLPLGTTGDDRPRPRRPRGRDLGVVRRRRARRTGLGVPGDVRSRPRQRVHAAARRLRGDRARIRRARVGADAVGPRHRPRRQQPVPHDRHRPRHAVRRARHRGDRHVPGRPRRRDRATRRVDRTEREQGRQRRRRRRAGGRAEARAVLLDTFRELDQRLEHQPVPARRPTHRGRHPTVRHARALRPDRQRRPDDQRRPQRLSEPVGLRPRPVLDPRVPRHHRLHVVQRTDRLGPTGAPRRPADRRPRDGRLPEPSAPSRRRARRHRVPPRQLARPVRAADRDLHRRVLDVARARPPSAACSTSSRSRTRSVCSRRGSAVPTGAPTRSAVGSTRC